MYIVNFESNNFIYLYQKDIHIIYIQNINKYLYIK